MAAIEPMHQNNPIFTGVNIASGKDLLPVRHQVITWTNANSLSLGSLGKKIIE